VVSTNAAHTTVTTGDSNAWAHQTETFLAEAREGLSRAQTVEAVQTLVSTAARRVTRADGATFVLRDGGNCYYVEEDAIALLWKGQRFPITTCISGWTMLNREPAAIDDIYVDARIPHEAYRPTFVKSLAMVPIRPDRPVGAIGAYWRVKHRVTAAELDAMRALAAAADEALARIADEVGHLDVSI
jgi:GAF domain-containing protein